MQDLRLLRPVVLITLFLRICAALIASSAAASPGAMLLVVNKAEARMAMIDPASLQVIAHVPTGEGPHEVAASADGRFAFVSNYGTRDSPGSTLSVIDLAARKEIKRVDLGPLLRPHGLVEAGGKVYFTAEGSRAVARFDPAAGRIDWLMGTGQDVTHMLVVTAQAKKIYTANIGSDTVTVIAQGEAPGRSRIAQIAVGRQPEGMDIAPDGRELWVGHNDDGSLSIIDTRTDKVQETIQVGQTPIRVKFTPDGRRVLIADERANEVVVFDAATRTAVKRIGVAVPIGILITPDSRRAFVASPDAHKVSVIDLETLELIASMSPGKEPDGMAWVGRVSENRGRTRTN